MEYLLYIVLAVISITVLVLLKPGHSDSRQKEMGALAARFGLRFNPERDERLPEQFGFLSLLSTGDRRCACNAMRGNYNGQQLLAFDYECHYGGKQHERTQTTVMLLFLPLPFPRLSVVRETPVMKLAKLAGVSDIQFESAEFSRNFLVRSDNKKFAYDICHPAMMHYMLQNPDLNIEIGGRILALGCGRLVNGPEFILNLTRLLQVRSLMPKYLFP